MGTYVTNEEKAGRIVYEAADDARRGVDRSRDIVELLADDPEEAFATAFEYQHAFHAVRRQSCEATA